MKSGWTIFLSMWLSVAMSRLLNQEWDCPTPQSCCKDWLTQNVSDHVAYSLASKQGSIRGGGFLILFFNFTVLYWFCHISTWIRHRYTRVPHPEPSSLLPPRTIPLGHPSAPAPSIKYRASNLDWWLFCELTFSKLCLSQKGKFMSTELEKLVFRDKNNKISPTSSSIVTRPRS